VFLQNSEVPAIFWIYFPKDNSVEYVHGTVDRVHWLRLTGLQTSLNASRWLLDQQLGLNQANWYLGF
jgi:hypothetical protein